MECSIDLSIYSPRFGHEDLYEMTMTESELKIKTGGKEAICNWIDNKDPEWEGYEDHHNNPLLNIFENDSIYAPSIFIFALESAWKEWRDGTIDNNDLGNELNELIDWLNLCSKNKPQSDFWTTIF